MDDDTLEPKDLEEDESETDSDDLLINGKKKSKKSGDDDVTGEEDSLDDLADTELGEEDEPYDDVDKW